MKRGRKRTRQLGDIEREVLQELSGGDLLYGFLLSGRSTKRMFKLARERATYRYRRGRAIERLTRDAYIQVHAGKLSITPIGLGAIGKAIENNLEFLRTKTWDHKWRIVVYDIPDRLAPLRKRIRDILKRAGFCKLQQSVWVFPHDCEELIELMREESRLTPYILYGVLDRIENEQHLKRTFKL